MRSAALNVFALRDDAADVKLPDGLHHGSPQIERRVTPRSPCDRLL
jgi:hypothetical protein